MPVKIIEKLRLLNPTFAIIMKTKPPPTPKPNRGGLFSRVFPHKLKYQSFSKRLGFPMLNHSQFAHVRTFSTRDVKASKSLIEDEAELSDWVSDLRSDSFLANKSKPLYSESDDNADFGRPSKGDFSGKRRRDGGDFAGRRGGFSRDSFDSRGNGRSGGSKDYGMSSRGRGGSMNGERGGRDFDSDDYGRGGASNRARGRGGRDFDSGDYGRGGVSNRARGRGGRDFDSSDYGRGGVSNRGRGSRDFDSGGYGRGGVSNRGRGNRDFDTDDYGRGGSSKRGRGGHRDSFDSSSRDSKLGNRGGRGSEIGYRGDRGGGRGGTRTGSSVSKRGGLMMSDTDDFDEDEDEVEDSDESVEKVRGSFRELISEDNSEDDSESVDDEEDDDEASKNASSFSRMEIKESPSASPESSQGGSDSYLSETRFDQCSVSSSSLKAIKDAGYEKMTVVQAATLPVILKGKDVLAKARTGTGKTVAFLLPSIELVTKSPPVDRDQKRPPIIVLVICPTRELASQAAAEANKLLKYHPSIGVQVVIGGTRLGLEQKRMQTNPCQILVATPGRLKDHIENTPGFATRLMGVKALVLDEADHLLDMGFRKDIERIIAAVPKQRQTLLFSATVPQEVRQICHVALKRDHEYIDTVQGSEETHAQVTQTHLVATMDQHFPLLYALLKEHIADDVDYKVLVFCTTAMFTRLVADLLGELKLNVREIHSRKPQSYRTRVSDEFRKSKGLILVTSDVSARGVDYPDVTLVIQVGIPADKEQYIHRLGRTGRKGKEGLGILLLAPWEEYFLSTIRDLPISKASSPSVDPDTKKKVEKALSHVEMKNKEAAYQAWLGYYNSVKNVGKDKYRLVELANEFSRCMGLDNPPAISKLVLGKMGLRNIPGLRSK
ncbi:DEAD-box ATP-dependent RNA helicase 31-like [Heracleum sosnowskyi]|uniref:ATP-dependent RNA helicase n=1 Tax=Heracleum sosnowskyi TaxID=360622 RepID=A0AAD8I231_9APIA|nr:DEAD-box ATP-dependent RNA helicase 31-like [Heracleum sosnowskyi]